MLCVTFHICSFCCLQQESYCHAILCWSVMSITIPCRFNAFCCMSAHILAYVVLRWCLTYCATLSRSQQWERGPPRNRQQSHNSRHMAPPRQVPLPPQPRGTPPPPPQHPAHPCVFCPPPQGLMKTEAAGPRLHPRPAPPPQPWRSQRGTSARRSTRPSWRRSGDRPGRRLRRRLRKRGSGGKNRSKSPFSPLSSGVLAGSVCPSG